MATSAITRTACGLLLVIVSFPWQNLTANVEGAHATTEPNIILILADDMGYSDLGCYGGEIHTPNIDRLAAHGLRFSQAYNTSKCFPSRASLLTGLYAQQCGFGETFKDPLRNAITLGEVLRESGYATYWSGKHHGVDNPMDRGFDAYYGLRDGACNHFNPGLRREGEPEPAKKPGRPPRIWRMDGETYAPYTPKDPNFYTTDAFTDKALDWLTQHSKADERPFFLYLAYTAPHDPLMAWPEDIAKYAGQYASGYASIRDQRLQRQMEIGLIAADELPSESTHRIWNQLTEEEQVDEALRMEVYAAMVDRMDQNIGRIIEWLEKEDVLENTLILIASDNGSSAEVTNVNPSGTIGTIDRWASLGKDWANVSNTPLRYFKNDSFEGGIRTPLIAHWPNGIKESAWVREAVHFIDIMSTFVDITNYNYPQEWRGERLPQLPGNSLLPFFAEPSHECDRILYWEWGRGRAVRFADWKWVQRGTQVGLFDLSTDPYETVNRIDLSPALGEEMENLFVHWKQRVTDGN
jgi:arylsulfatase